MKIKANVFRHRFYRTNPILKGIATAFYAYFIYTMSSQDTSSVSLPLYTDKLIHFAEFGLLCLMICWTIASIPIKSYILFCSLSIGIASLYGLTDELHQYLVPGRSMDVFDWAADIAGAVTASVFWQKYVRKWRECS